MVAKRYSIDHFTSDAMPLELGVGRVACPQQAAQNVLNCKRTCSPSTFYLIDSLTRIIRAVKSSSTSPHGVASNFLISASPEPILLFGIEHDTFQD